MDYLRYGLRKRPMGPSQAFTTLFQGKKRELLKASLAALALATIGAIWIILAFCF